MLKPILTMVIVLVVGLSSMACRHVDPELLDALFSDLPVDYAPGMCDRKDNSWR
ncbi:MULTISPECIES: hypothetical protein [Bartonella]|uniref:Lipoprotein n=1 Tax=Bartonella chomelii TaxID=236402 RepID=A0ABR6E3D6_9HYPH|nr:MULTISPECIES: hypothetical protein [Bartonella]MBA9082773.1 hypothetical protein [Bartonella chomelii]